jgi:alanyl-tRNA synthetase
MTEQRERAKADAKAKKTGHHADLSYRDLADASAGHHEFTGYDEVVSEARSHCSSTASGAAAPARATTSRSCSTARRSTPRAAGSSPTRADRARRRRVVEVLRRPGADHRARRAPRPGRRGRGRGGTRRTPVVDVERRKAISRAHTATHMVHKAFREALGDTATQAGSENAPGRLRLRLPAAGAVPPSVLPTSRTGSTPCSIDDLEVTRR